jgi:hypothetical protein
MGNSAGKIAEKIEDLDFDEQSDDEIDDLVDAIEDEDALKVPLKAKICDTCPVCSDCPDCPDCSLKLGGDPDSKVNNLILTSFSNVSHCEAVVEFMKMNIYEAVAKVNADADATSPLDTATVKNNLGTVQLGPGNNTLGADAVDALFLEEVITYDDTSGELTFDGAKFDELVNCEAATDDSDSEGYRLKYGAAVDSEAKRKRFNMKCDIAIVILLLLILWLVKTRKR